MKYGSENVARAAALRLIRRLQPQLNRSHGKGWGSKEAPPVNNNQYRYVRVAG